MVSGGPARRAPEQCKWLFASRSRPIHKTGDNKESDALKAISDAAPGTTAGDREKFEAMVRDLHMRIGFDGTWFYHNSPIRRMPLVKLFATVLQRDDEGEYWLITPVEKGRIEVEDVPFVAVEMTVEGQGSNRSLTLRTNIDDIVTVGADHALRFDHDPDTGEPRPYVHVHRGLEARLSRAVFYQLVDLGEETPVGIDAGNADFGVWAGGKFWPIGNSGGNSKLDSA